MHGTSARGTSFTYSFRGVSYAYQRVVCSFTIECSRCAYLYRYSFCHPTRCFSSATPFCCARMLHRACAFLGSSALHYSLVLTLSCAVFPIPFLFCSNVWVCLSASPTPGSHTFLSLGHHPLVRPLPSFLLSEMLRPTGLRSSGRPC